MRLDKRKALNKDSWADSPIGLAGSLKAGVRANVKHPFRVLKHKLGFVCESSLSRPEETHDATLYTVCTVQLMDGARQTDGIRGISAAENSISAPQRAERTKIVAKNDGVSGDVS